MKKRKLLLLLVTFALLAGFSRQYGYAQAQPQILLNSVEVSLLPEFNHTSMLVIYEIELEENTPLPQELILHIPPDAQLLFVANREQDDSIVALENIVTQIGGWKDVRFRSTTHAIRLEYLDPNLITQDDHRTFEYEWLSIYPVSSFSLLIRRPSGVSDIITEPSMKRSTDVITGSEYYSVEISTVPAEELYSLTLTYTINPSDLAYPAQDVEAAATINEATSGRSSSPLSVVLWLLTIAVAVLIMVGFYYWWFRTNASDKRDRIVQGVGIMNPEKQVIFCHECGMRSGLEDSFCSNCGTELRKPTRFERPPQI